ncbi:MAG: hypothetical protein AVDCRST_MAG45-1949, partial [uncultured Solirubrobacterales bacterium]
GPARVRQGRGGAPRRLQRAVRTGIRLCSPYVAQPRAPRACARPNVVRRRSRGRAGSQGRHRDLAARGRAHRAAGLDRGAVGARRAGRRGRLRVGLRTGPALHRRPARLPAARPRPSRGGPARARLAGPDHRPDSGVEPARRSGCRPRRRMADAPPPRAIDRRLRARAARHRDDDVRDPEHGGAARAARGAPVRPLGARDRDPGRAPRRPPLARHRRPRGAVRAESGLHAEPVRRAAGRLAAVVRARPARRRGGGRRRRGGPPARLPARRARPLRCLPRRHPLPHQRPRRGGARRRAGGAHADPGGAVRVDRLCALLAGDPRGRPGGARRLPPPRAGEARGLVLRRRRLSPRTRRRCAGALVAQRHLPDPRARGGGERAAHRAPARDRQRDARAPVSLAALGLPRPGEHGHRARGRRQGAVRGSRRGRAADLTARRGAARHRRPHGRERARRPGHRRLARGRSREHGAARRRARHQPDRPPRRHPAPARRALSGSAASVGAARRRRRPRLRRLPGPPLRGSPGDRVAAAAARGDPGLRRPRAALPATAAAGTKGGDHARGRQGARPSAVRLPDQALRTRRLHGVRGSDAGAV